MCSIQCNLNTYSPSLSNTTAPAPRLALRTVCVRVSKSIVNPMRVTADGGTSRYLRSRKSD
eukprot:6192720-Pleurochrysis_carterae.AAC.1